MADKESALADAIREMRAATEALRTLISKDYPTRRELERRFVQKSTQRTRVGVVVLALLGAMLGGFFGTIATVTTCFVGEIGDAPRVCNVMPGFAEAEKQNQQLIQEFRELQKRSRVNQDRIEKLEARP